MRQLSPKETVRAQCSNCLGLIRWDRKEVESCKGDTYFTGPCCFFSYRLGKRIPIKVFRAFCIHCMGGQSSLVEGCTSPNCKVYPYRMGKNPSLTGKRKGNIQGVDALKKYAERHRDVDKFQPESIVACLGIPLHG
jgi:hypothetical protein